MRKIYKGLLILSLMSILISACGTAPLISTTKESQPSPRTLSINGIGKSYLTPDIAYISIGVHTEGEDAAEAVASNNSKSTRVSDALKNMGVEAKDIQTSNFSIYPQQQYDEAGQVISIRYVVDNTVYVTLRKLNAIGEMLNEVVKAGANSINGIQFDVADRSAALSEARKAAIADARVQAEEIAQNAGITLGAIQSLSTWNSIPTQMFEGKGGGGALLEAAAPISPGQLVVQVEVNIVFQIED